MSVMLQPNAAAGVPALTMVLLAGHSPGVRDKEVLLSGVATSASENIMMCNCTNRKV